MGKYRVPNGEPWQKYIPDTEYPIHWVHGSEFTEYETALKYVEPEPEEEEFEDELDDEITDAENNYDFIAKILDNSIKKAVPLIENAYNEGKITDDDLIFIKDTDDRIGIKDAINELLEIEE